MTAAGAAAAAGFAVSRLLLVAPDDAMAARLADRHGRLSWPIRNESTVDALKQISHGFDSEATRAEWALLFSDQAGSIRMRESSRTGADPDVLATQLDELYHSTGFARAAAAEHPSDQLGVELMFAAQLVAEFGRAEANPEQQTHWREQLATFSTTHLDRFCDEVLTDISVRADSALLAAIPGLVIGYRQALSALIDGDSITITGNWS